MCAVIVWRLVESMAVTVGCAGVGMTGGHQNVMGTRCQWIWLWLMVMFVVGV